MSPLHKHCIGEVVGPSGIQSLLQHWSKEEFQAGDKATVGKARDGFPKKSPKRKQSMPPFQVPGQRRRERERQNEQHEGCTRSSFLTMLVLN
mmetsp:Transcript_27829/g.64463  ORF Transcript_27829/g.64463 Transcript_27829/m.64463 type:complete len:92 (+) Transcript_27829:182-457(+)